MEARQETATTRNLSPPSMVGRTSEAGKMNRASRGPTIPGTLDRADRPDPRHPATVITKRAIFRIGRKKGDFLTSGDSEAICVRAKYER